MGAVVRGYLFTYGNHRSFLGLWGCLFAAATWSPMNVWEARSDMRPDALQRLMTVEASDAVYNSALVWNIGVRTVTSFITLTCLIIPIDVRLWLACVVFCMVQLTVHNHVQKDYDLSMERTKALRVKAEAHCCEFTSQPLQMKMYGMEPAYIHELQVQLKDITRSTKDESYAYGKLMAVNHLLMRTFEIMFMFCVYFTGNTSRIFELMAHFHMMSGAMHGIKDACIRFSQLRVPLGITTDFMLLCRGNYDSYYVDASGSRSGSGSGSGSKSSKKEKSVDALNASCDCDCDCDCDYDCDHGHGHGHIIDVVSIKGLNFKYKPDDVSYILNNLELSIAPKERVLLHAQSGKGKSTLFKLLCKLYPDTYEGNISILGQELRNMSHTELHRKLAVVPQEPIWFSQQTLRYNLTLSSDYTRVFTADLKTYLTHLGLQEWANDADLESVKSTISGGQKQRVALIRGLIRETPLLLLDESTSALDAANEASVMRLLEQICGDKTVIWITHKAEELMRGHKWRHVHF